MATEDEKKVFALSEVKDHSTSNDCWLLIDKKVYDVSKFMDDHPGGDEVLLSATGRDATDDFEDVGHSTSARDLMKQYHIGDIDISTVPAKVTYSNPVTQAHYTHDKSREFLIKILQFVVPLGILGLALLARFLTKKEEPNP